MNTQTNNSRLVKKTLKLKKRHPKKRMYLGQHLITNIPKEFSLDKENLEELASVGGKHWFVEVKINKVEKKK